MNQFVDGEFRLCETMVFKIKVGKIDKFLRTPDRSRYLYCATLFFFEKIKSKLSRYCVGLFLFVGVFMYELGWAKQYLDPA